MFFKHINRMVFCLIILSSCISTPTDKYTFTESGNVTNSTVSSNTSKSNSLPTNFPINSLKFSHLTGEDGISQSVINCMFQDKFGYIWLGTEDGLNKYDGKTITVFKNDPDDPYSISYNDITAIVEGPDETLWIGTNGGGLNALDRATGKFRSIRYDPEDFFRYLVTFSNQLL